MLCRPAFSIPSIVGRWGECKSFLTHRNGLEKRRKNSALKGVPRTITGVCTAYPLLCPQQRFAIPQPTNGACQRCTFTTASSRRRRQCEQFRARDHDDALVGTACDLGQSGEAPECRQDRSPRTEYEARLPCPDGRRRRTTSARAASRARARRAAPRVHRPRMSRAHRPPRAMLAANRTRGEGTQADVGFGRLHVDAFTAHNQGRL